MAKDPNVLTAREALFVEAYVLNGGNATRAYQVCLHPKPVSDASAAVLGWRLLRTVKVAAALEKRREQQMKLLQMAGEEALALISMRARADVAAACDARGRLLPFHLWPESLRLAARTRRDKDGQIEWQFADGLKAAELMAIANQTIGRQTHEGEEQVKAHHVGCQEDAETADQRQQPPDDKCTRASYGPQVCTQVNASRKPEQGSGAKQHRPDLVERQGQSEQQLREHEARAVWDDECGHQCRQWAEAKQRRHTRSCPVGDTGGKHCRGQCQGCGQQYIGVRQNFSPPHRQAAERCADQRSACDRRGRLVASDLQKLGRLQWHQAK